MLFSSRAYEIAGKVLQELVISGRSAVRRAIREGTRFAKVLEEVELTQWLNTSELEELQLRRLKQVVKHAEENVPYYRNSFKRLGVCSSDIKTLGDIRNLPILSRQDILSNGTALLTDNRLRFHFKGGTSGTTGSPINIYHDLNSVIRENAFIWRQLHWAGFRRGQKRAWLRGDLIVPVKVMNAPFWRLNRTESMLMMSSFHLSEINSESYINALEKFDPVLIQAYPSSISFLARYLSSKGQFYRGKSLKSIVTSSECLRDSQRQVIQDRMGCMVFDWYGSYERVACIGTCEKGSYHVNSDYGAIELNEVDEGMSEIIGTSFNNFLMPLLRYKTNDQVEVERVSLMCSCGRSLPVVKRIIGRDDQALKTRDGRSIGRFTMIFEDVEHIAEAQVVQNSLDEIDILVVPLRGFGRKQAVELQRKALQRLGSNMRVNVEIVAHIARTERGKFPNVICNV